MMDDGNSVMSAREQARSFLVQGKTVRAAGLMLKLIETEPTAENLTLLADIYMSLSSEVWWCDPPPDQQICRG